MGHRLCLKYCVILAFIFAGFSAVATNDRREFSRECLRTLRDVDDPSNLATYLRRIPLLTARRFSSGLLEAMRTQLESLPPTATQYEVRDRITDELFRHPTGVTNTRGTRTRLASREVENLIDALVVWHRDQVAARASGGDGTSAETLAVSVPHLGDSLRGLPALRHMRDRVSTQFWNDYQTRLPLLTLPDRFQIRQAIIEASLDNNLRFHDAEIEQITHATNAWIAVRVRSVSGRPGYRLASEGPVPTGVLRTRRDHSVARA